MILDVGKPASSSQLRWFSGIWLPALSAGLALMLYREAASTAAVAVLSIGLGLSVAGLLVQSVANAVYRLLIVLTMPIGWALSWVVLIVLYFGLVTPIGALVRAVHDPMRRRFDRPAPSYWTRRVESPRSRYVRQF